MYLIESMKMYANVNYEIALGIVKSGWKNQSDCLVPLVSATTVLASQTSCLYFMVKSITIYFVTNLHKS